MTDPRSLLSTDRLVADLIPILQEKVVVRYAVERSSVLTDSETEPALRSTAHFVAIRKQRLINFGVEFIMTPTKVELGETWEIFNKDIPEGLLEHLKSWKESERNEWCISEQFVGVVRFVTGVQTSLPVTHDYFKLLHGFAASAVENKMHELYHKSRASIFEADIFAYGIDLRFKAFLCQTLYTRYSEDFVR